MWRQSLVLRNGCVDVYEDLRNDGLNKLPFNRRYNGQIQIQICDIIIRTSYQDSIQVRDLSPGHHLSPGLKSCHVQDFYIRDFRIRGQKS